MLDLSIIVVAHNSEALLRATLASVTCHTRGLSYEVIVVDTSPPPGIMPLDHEFAHIRWIRSPRNAGFAAANNLGLSMSQGRSIALLNPDTLLRDDVFTALVNWLDDHAPVGAVGPQLVQIDGQPQPYSYGSAPTPAYLIRRIWSRLRGRYLHEWTGTQPQVVDWVAGTCMVVRRSALESIGGLDERFFLYFEDVDLGWRLRRAGWSVMFLPHLRITHIGGGSVGSQARQHYDRSLARLYAKYYGSIAGFGVWLALRLYRAGQAASSNWRLGSGGGR